MKRTRGKFVLLSICLIGLWTQVADSEAAIINASSCSLEHVTAAYNAASVGDIVAIPEGNCTWSAGLTISKALTLKGAGISSTIINHSGGSSLVSISLNSDVAVRITGIYFKYSTNNTGGSAVAINGKSDGSFGLTKIRIDHNKFEKGTRTVHAIGWTYGVVDHNQFVNCNIAVGTTGDNDYSWSRPIVAGTANALFIEDNVFTIDNNADREPNEQIYHQEGGRTVVRYNTFDGSAFTGGQSLILDSHGNYPSEYNVIKGYRGQPIIEFYNNSIHVYQTYRHMNIRGGSVLVHDNVFTGGYTIYLSEEELWSMGGPWCNGSSGNPAYPGKAPCPASITYPLWDQVNNSFFWNNTKNGAAFNPNTDSPDFIKEGRDYFLHAPQNSGGKSIYPTVPGSNDMIFSSSGANAYYPYTPYTYPHPLTSPYPPRNLSIGQ